MTDQTAVMFACYQVASQDQSDFLQLLVETEAVYRKHATITETPILRLQSLEDPAFVVEIIEWKSQQALEGVMANEEIMAQWSAIKAAWKHGDMGFDQIPEAKIPWAVMRPFR